MSKGAAVEVKIPEEDQRDLDEAKRRAESIKRRLALLGIEVDVIRRSRDATYSDGS